MNIQGVKFGQAINYVNKTQNGYNTNPILNNSNNSDKKLKVVLDALAILGIAAIAVSVAKTHPVDKLKSSLKTFSDFMKKPQDPIVKALKGRRDIEGVNTYKRIIAQKKLASLQEKLNTHQFSAENVPIHHILDNYEMLKKEAQVVL